jgi:MFS transporter, DHA2 family, multidrug resistance protein
MLQNKIFFDWVHRELHLLLLIILLIPLSMSTGVIGSGSIYFTGSLSAIPADITMASYAGAIGLVTGIPLVLRLKQFISSKVILLGVYTGLIGTNIMLGLTDEPLILVMASFIAGFMKIIGLLEILATLLPILMPKGERYRLYGVYYPVNLITTQIITIVFVSLANQFNWQISQLALNIPLLAGLIIVILFVHPYFPGRKVPLYQVDWFSLLLVAAGMLLLDYVLTYGQVKDWLASKEIIAGIIFSLLAVTILISRTFALKRPFLDLLVLRYKNVQFGLFVMFLLGLFYAASNIQTALLATILKNDVIENTRINLYLIPGLAVGTVIGYFYFKYRNSFKFIIVLVVSCYTISFIQFYFLTTLLATSADFYWPMFFRGVAIVLSYMAIGIYISTGIPFEHFFPVVFYYLTVRTFLGPVIWSSLLSNFYYRRTIGNLTVLASKIDITNPGQQGVNFGRIQGQASLLALRETFGLIALFGILLIIGLVLSRIYDYKGAENPVGFVLP